MGNNKNKKWKREVFPYQNSLYDPNSRAEENLSFPVMSDM